MDLVESFFEALLAAAQVVNFGSYRLLRTPQKMLPLILNRMPLRANRISAIVVLAYRRGFLLMTHHLHLGYLTRLKCIVPISLLVIVARYRLGGKLLPTTRPIPRSTIANATAESRLVIEGTAILVVELNVSPWTRYGF